MVFKYIQMFIHNKELEEENKQLKKRNKELTKQLTTLNIVLEKVKNDNTRFRNIFEYTRLP